jgi:alpha-beta hydrolase superfamily lysophospholipase
VEVITRDPDYTSKQHKIILYGHSMSTAIALAVAAKMESVGGMILINPPHKLKKAKGMSPGFGQYVKYAFYMIFAPHKPVVNMAGDPARIEDPEDRADAESRIGDPLLVSHFSLYYMMQSHKLMKTMARYAESAGYPLLLVYGLKDNVVDKKGCDILFDSWGSEDKEYILIENGAHGRSTILQAQPFIQKWMEER